MGDFEEIEALLAAEDFTPGRAANFELAELLGEEKGVAGSVRDFCGDETLCLDLLGVFPGVTGVEIIGEQDAWLCLFSHQGRQFATESFPKRSHAAAAALYGYLTGK